MSSLATTVPAGLEHNIGLFSFGSMGTNWDFTFYDTTNEGGFHFNGDPTIRTASFPNLTTIDPTNAAQGGLSIDNCSGFLSCYAPVLQTCGGSILLVNIPLGTISLPNLTTILGEFLNPTWSGAAFQCSSFSAPLLTTVMGQLELYGSASYVLPSLTTVGNSSDLLCTSGAFTGTSISLPALTSVGGRILGGFAANLVTFNVPVLLPHAGMSIIFNSCPNLSVTTVNQILSRCVASAAFSGPSSTVTLDGAPPSGQGVTDKATLIGRGCTVTTN